MEKDDIRLAVATGLGLSGVGLQMTGLPHVVGWAIVVLGVGVAIYPWAARKIHPEQLRHAANDLRDSLANPPPSKAQKITEELRAQSDGRHSQGSLLEEQFASQFASASAAASERDTKLGDALAYAVTGKWDRHALWEKEGGAISTAGDTLKRFEQLACDGKLQFWGMKSQNLGPYVKIAAPYWEDHNVHFMSLFKESAAASSYTTVDQSPEYFDLMVSRSEIIKYWPPVVPASYRVEWGRLRARGVELRNLGHRGIYAEHEWAEWRQQLAAWNATVTESIREIDAGDAEWYATLDVVPQPRIPMDSMFSREEDKEIYDMHDFRLAKLEQLIRQHGGKS